jgi:hypothetical protein
VLSLSSGICGGQSGAGAGFVRVLRFPLPSSFHQILHPHNWPWQVKQARSGRSAEWAQFGGVLLTIWNLFNVKEDLVPSRERLMCWVLIICVIILAFCLQIVVETMDFFLTIICISTIMLIIYFLILLSC